MAGTVRAERGADGKPAGAGAHAGEENLPLRPPGLPLALIDETGAIAWQAEYDEWGNQLKEESPDHPQ